MHAFILILINFFFLINSKKKNGKNQNVPKGTVLVVIGNWITEKNKHFKFKAPSPKKKMLNMFLHDPRFVIVTINESYTTKTCSKCKKITLGNVIFYRTVHNCKINNSGARFSNRVLFYEFFFVYLCYYLMFLSLLLLFFLNIICFFLNYLFFFIIFKYFLFFFF